MNRVEYPLKGSFKLAQMAEILNRSMWCSRKNMDVEIIPSDRAFFFDFTDATDAILFKMRWD